MTRDHSAGLARAAALHARFLAGIPEPDPNPPRIAVDRHALYAAFGRRSRYRSDPALGVICAAESSAFPGLKLMMASLLLSHDVPVTVFDLGLTADQRAWLGRQPVSVVVPDLPEGHRFATHGNRWALWIKPYLMDRTPYDLTVWLDSDLIVRRDLSPLAAMADDNGGVAIFPDTFANHDVLQNWPALYKQLPVPEEWESVNSGVIAYRRGHPFVALARWMIDWIIAEPTRADLIGGWDQGCIKWALESLGIPPIAAPSWNRPGWTLAEFGKSLTPDEVIERSAPGEITHFQATPKPWERWADYSMSLRPAPGLAVAILGHEPFERPAREWITEVNLTDHDPDQSWGESRYFDLLGAAIPWPEAEYVGLATFSWAKKYDAVGRLSPHEFGELALSPGVAWCAVRTDDRMWLPYPDWADHIEHFNPGVKPLIAELRRVSGLREMGVSAWSNNWIVHRSVFADLVAFYRRMATYFKAKYPACPYAAVVPAKEWGYLAEAITVHYLASRGDLEFREMQWGGEPGPGRSEKALPSLWRQGVNLAGAAARHAADGGRKACAATKAARLAACGSCPELRASDRRCASCGCPVDVKAEWASERCPLGKWTSTGDGPVGCGCGK